MEQQTICTAYEAAAAWDLSRDGSRDFEGMLLVLDLDRGGAGLCRCHPDQAPAQVWEHTGTLSGSFFQDAVWTLMPGCASADGARALRESLTGLMGKRPQKNYLRSGRTRDMDLPEIELDGQVYSVTCGALAAELERTHGPALSRMLAEAREELERRGAAENCRILPVGELANLYMAEYMVRETFLVMPMLEDNRLRLCTGREDPARIVEQGYQVYSRNYGQEKNIGKHLLLQVLRRNGAVTASELLTLARNDSTYSQLRQAAYVGPICITPGEPLIVFADSEMHRMPVPAEILSHDGGLSCVEVGIVAENEALYLAVRNQSGRTVRLTLDQIVN